MKDTTGLDMAATIAWYEKLATELMSRLPEALEDSCFIKEPTTQEGGVTPLTRWDMNALVHLFHPNAVNRSVLKTIVVESARWFGRDLSDGPKITNDLDRALSPTAIIPSMITYEQDASAWSGFRATIHLFTLAGNFVSPSVPRIIHAQGFVHEVAHSIVNTSLYGTYKLRMPDGTVVDGGEKLLEFQELVRGLPPISHYASAYMDGVRVKDDITALSEVIVETMTAMLLGFAFRPHDDLGLTPMADREPAGTFLRDFLTAERVE